jgi:hypothetical protein
MLYKRKAKNLGKKKSWGEGEEISTSAIKWEQGEKSEEKGRRSLKLQFSKCHVAPHPTTVKVGLLDGLQPDYRSNPILSSSICYTAVFFSNSLLSIFERGRNITSIYHGSCYLLHFGKYSQ